MAEVKMTDRDKLIELLKEAEEHPEKTCPHYLEADCFDCPYDRGEVCDREARKADYLLANGVIVLPCKAGDKVAVRALCECVYTLPIYEECRNECPFEDDCPCEKCDDANERIFVTKVNRIFNDGYGWKFEFNHLGVEASISDFGVSFFVGEDAEQQAKEYEQALAERREE